MSSPPRLPDCSGPLAAPTQTTVLRLLQSVTLVALVAVGIIAAGCVVGQLLNSLEPNDPRSAGIRVRETSEPTVPSSFELDPSPRDERAVYSTRPSLSSAGKTGSVGQPERGHVVLIAVDGLRPDVVSQVRTPTLWALIQSGAYTGQAQNILPSLTLPNHTAMLTGLDTAGHGQESNWSWGNERLRVPTIFDAARADGLSTAFYYGKHKMSLFERPDSLNWASRKDGADIAGDFARDFRRAKWNLTMLCFPDCDEAGHFSGWMSRDYLEAVQRVDAYLTLVVEAIRLSGLAERTHILLTSDHGGSGFDHYDDVPVHRTVPFLVYGPSVAVGARLGSLACPVSVMDMAPTAAHLLQLRLPGRPRGRLLSEAFVTIEPPAEPAKSNDISPSVPGVPSR